MTTNIARLPISPLRASPRKRGDIERGLASARVMARAWSKTVPEGKRQKLAWGFIAAAIERYAELAQQKRGLTFRLMPPPIAADIKLETTVLELARAVGEEVSGLPICDAAFQLSATYTALVPDSLRSQFGMYYTPPALTERLLDMVEECGTNWKKVRVLDPACGGGAFLLPVAMRMRNAVRGLPAAEQLTSITSRLRGFEIDPFAAWLTQTWLEIALADLSEASGMLVPSLVKVCDTLNQKPDSVLYDVVVGNPPYGRTSLSDAQRTEFSRSLYGHANLYGVFTDIALRWTQPGGIIAFVTPPSFLSGQYFKALRSLLVREAPPTSLDFISARRGVFEDVLQETILATYKRGAASSAVTVRSLDVAPNSPVVLEEIGTFRIPTDASSPWLAPRDKVQAKLLEVAGGMPSRLKDWGYEVSTGPLVWNRFKTQLRDKAGKQCFPIVWAEAITGPDGFAHRADKRDHQPYIRLLSVDEWLRVTDACVLVQRTTAKEQPRRLIAAEMPSRFIETHGGVVVENHLNMVRAVAGQSPKVDTATLAAVLNSRTVDSLFRCISGSVAVSAFELEALPLPSPAQMKPIARLVAKNASVSELEAAIAKIYDIEAAQ